MRLRRRRLSRNAWRGRALARRRADTVTTVQGNAATESGEATDGAGAGTPTAPGGADPTTDPTSAGSSTGPQAPTPTEALPDPSPTTNAIASYDPSDASLVTHGGLVLDGSSVVHETFGSDPLGSFNFCLAILLTADSLASESRLGISKTAAADYLRMRFQANGAIRFGVYDGTTSREQTSPAGVYEAGTAIWVFFSPADSEIQLAVNDELTVYSTSNALSYPSGGWDELLLGAFRTNGGPLQNFFDGTIHEFALFSGGLPAQPVREALYLGTPLQALMEDDGRTVHRHWILNDAQDRVATASLAALSGSPSFSSGGVVYLHSKFGDSQVGALNTDGTGFYRQTSLPAGFDGDDWALTVWHHNLGSGRPFGLGDGTTANRDYAVFVSASTVDFHATAGGSDTLNRIAHGGTNGRWIPFTIVKRSASLREYWIDGVLWATETDTRDNGSALDRLFLGSQTGADGSAQTTAASRVSLHSPAPAQEQIPMLHAGVEPRAIATCLAYYSAAGGTLVDAVTGNSLEDSGGVPAVSTDTFIVNERVAYRQLTASLRPDFASSPSAIQFDGASQYLEMAKTPGLGKPYTIVGVWVPTTQLDNNTVSLSFAKPGDETNERISLAWSGSIGIPAGIAHKVVEGGTPYAGTSDSDWAHDAQSIVTVIHEGSELTLRHQNSPKENPSIDGDPETPTRSVLGADITTSGALDLYWAGKLLGLEIYPRALGASEARGREDVLEALAA